MKRTIAVTTAALCLLSVCWAQSEQPASVTVGGELILRIRFSAGGMTPQQRADAITLRLRSILADPQIEPSDIVVKPLAYGEAGIYVKDLLLVTVDHNHARANKTTPLKLGEIWAEHLRKVVPQVNIKQPE